MTMEERYQRLEDTVRAYNPTASFDKIRAAYEFAAAAHQGQLRKDGSPFVTHPLGDYGPASGRFRRPGRIRPSRPSPAAPSAC